MALGRSLDSYFAQRGTCVVRFVGNQFVCSIETDTGWYVEPPPQDSMMGALHVVRVWARDNNVDVTVIEDLDNCHFREKGKVPGRVSLHVEMAGDACGKARVS
jgi:hypothetical protein